MGSALLDGTHVLHAPADAEHARALERLEQYEAGGVDFPDSVVMAMAEVRRALILTWDFRHF